MKWREGERCMNEISEKARLSHNKRFDSHAVVMQSSERRREGRKLKLSSRTYLACVYERWSSRSSLVPPAAKCPWQSCTTPRGPPRPCQGTAPFQLSMGTQTTETYPDHRQRDGQRHRQNNLRTNDLKMQFPFCRC